MELIFTIREYNGTRIDADFRDLKVSGWEVRFGTNVYFLFNLQLLIPKVESFVNRLGVTPFVTDEYLRGTGINLLIIGKFFHPSLT